MVHEGGPKASDQFAFIQVNQKDGAASSASPREVRQHAMRVALHRKKVGKRSASPELGLPFSHRTGRFRLATMTSHAKSSKSMVSTPTEVPEDNNDNPSKECDTWSISYVASRGLFDPFDSLPVKLGLRQQKLLSYYDKSFIQNYLAFNSRKRFLEISALDLAWANSTFALIALSHDLQYGIGQIPSTDYLFYRGQAFSFINKLLRTSQTQITDSTIGTAATLQLGYYDRKPVQRESTYEWPGADGTAYAAVFGGMPLLTAFQPNSKQSEYIQNLGNQWSPQNADELFQVELGELVQSLQGLSRIMEGQDLRENEKAIFSHELPIGQNRINRVLVVLGYHTTLSNVLTISFSTHLAASIYMNLAIRDTVAAAEMHHIMVKRLKATLERGGNEIILTWGENLEALLWTAFVGGAAALYWPERKFFVKILSRVRDCLLISSLEGFRDTLKRFAWLDKFCVVPSHALWDETEDPL